MGPILNSEIHCPCCRASLQLTTPIGGSPTVIGFKPAPNSEPVTPRQGFAQSQYSGASHPAGYNYYACPTALGNTSGQPQPAIVVAQYDPNQGPVHTQATAQTVCFKFTFKFD